MKKRVLVSLISSICLLFAYGTAGAKVKGVCQACHTMHNSQGGQPMAKTTGTGQVPYWNGDAINTATTNSSTPVEHLLRTDCIGCHSNAGTATIISYESNSVPIVHNTQKPAYETPGANNALAGGNFYWTDPNSGADFADNHGHNIFSQDATLSQAPGLNDHGVNCTNGCHHRLYNPIAPDGVTQLVGCQGCHYSTWHHKAKGPDAGAPGPDNLKVNPTYRFLAGHHLTETGTYGSLNYVQGIESGDYEQMASASDHNVYMANGASAAGSFVGAPTGIVNASNHSMSAFCAACHGAFHEDTMDTSSTWIRHPIDVLVSSLVSDGHEDETFFYNGPDGYGVNNYDPAVPVAYGIANPLTDSISSYSTISQTAGRVTCVSCHRTHASPYPSMLRFDYNQVIAGNGTVAGGNGCFACHTEKALK